MMSEPKNQKPEDKKGRVRVDNVPRQEKELNAGDAATIKGGGGVSGGVLKGGAQVMHIGEEIPQ